MNLPERIRALSPRQLALGAAVGVGVWLFFRRGSTMPSASSLPPVAPGQVLGYINGVASPITVISVGNGQVMRTDAARAFLALQTEAARAGITLTATSGYRSNEQQIHLYNGWMLKLPGYNLAAKPGWSNHQGGISVDIGGVNSFTSAAYAWLKANAARFGFKNDVSSEYWHWTYLPGATRALV